MSEPDTPARSAVDEGSDPHPRDTADDLTANTVGALGPDGGTAIGEGGTRPGAGDAPPDPPRPGPPLPGPPLPDATPGDGTVDPPPDSSEADRLRTGGEAPVHRGTHG